MKQITKAAILAAAVLFSGTARAENWSHIGTVELDGEMVKWSILEGSLVSRTLASGNTVYTASTSRTQSGDTDLYLAVVPKKSCKKHAGILTLYDTSGKVWLKHTFSFTKFRVIDVVALRMCAMSTQ